MQYYFFGTSLAPLQWGVQPEISLGSFLSLARENLNQPDYEKIQVIQRLYDLENIGALWKGQPLNPYGSFSAHELEEALIEGALLPGYVYDFMEQFKANEERLSHFIKILTDFFAVEIGKAQGLLKQLLNFERSLRLNLVLARSKLWKRPMAHELQFEDPQNELAAYLLSQKEADSFEPSEGYEALKKIVRDYKEDPVSLHQALLRFRFEQYEAASGLQVFSSDRILTYFLTLILFDQLKGIS